MCAQEATVAFPDRLLADDEEVVLHLHPHWKVLIRPVVLFVLIVLAASFGVGFIEVDAVRWAIVIVATGLVLYYTIRPFARWISTHFVLTTHRVLLREGLLARSGRDVPLARINDVSFEHSFFERMLGCGTLVVESAGERGQVVLRDIPQVESVQSTLYQMVEEDSERRATLRGQDDGT
jgi:uncharacterized membrane protein YdbT with pleckstrin-like domain